jgi:glycosyltransferase involved in cell wall biosynthesis
MIAMRILHLVARSHHRGAELAALDLARELDLLGYEDRMLALACAFDGSTNADLPPLTQSAALGAPQLASSVLRLRRALARDPVDVVIAHGGWPVQVAALARKRSSPPLLVWQRILGFPDNVWHGPRRVWWRAIARRTDAVVALTPENRNEMRRLGYTKSAWLIPNFRRPDRFATVDRAAAAERLREELHVGPNTPLVGLVGHLIEQKRPLRAVNALHQMQQHGVDAHLVVAGTGPLRDALQREIHERGLSSSVHLLGHRDDIEMVLGGLDTLLLTSDSEGIPGILIEAQMSGLPVVTVDVGGVSSVIEHNVTGIVVARNDVAALATETARLLRDRDVRHAMGAQARIASSRFTTAEAGRKYAECIKRLHDWTYAAAN